jgi:VanZ family protein
MNPRRVVGLAALVLSVAVILLLTLPPGPSTEAVPSPMCLRCGDTPLRDTLLNVLFFVPFGAAVAATGWRGPRAALAGFLLSAMIELLQAFVPGRVSSLRDVLANGLGALSGYLVMSHAAALVAPSRRAAAWLGTGALLGAVAGLGFTSWALRPSLPDDLYYGQWSPRFAWRPVFYGTVRSATIGGLPLPQGPERERGTLRREMIEGTRLTVAVIPGTPRPGAAPVVAVVDGHRREIATLMLRRDEAIFRSRSNASQLGLRTPAVALARAVAGDTNATWTITGLREPGRLAVTSVGPDGHSRSRVLQLSPGLGWYLTLPTPTGAGPEVPWLSGLWLAFCFFPTSYWWASVGGWTGRALLMSGVVVALFLFPALADVSPGPWWEWLGALAAALLGWAVAQRQLPRVTARA